jgi:hypothetical protein
MASSTCRGGSRVSDFTGLMPSRKPPSMTERFSLHISDWLRSALADEARLASFRNVCAGGTMAELLD